MNEKEEKIQKVFFTPKGNKLRIIDNFENASAPQKPQEAAQAISASITNIDLKEQIEFQEFISRREALEKEYAIFLALEEEHYKNSKNGAHDNFIQKVITDNKYYLKTEYEKLKLLLSSHTAYSNKTQALINQCNGLINKIQLPIQSINKRKKELTKLQDQASQLYQSIEEIKAKKVKFRETFKDLTAIEISDYDRTKNIETIKIIEKFQTLLDKESTFIINAASLNFINIDDNDYLLSLINKSIALYKALEVELKRNDHVMLDKVRFKKNSIILTKTEQELSKNYKQIINIIQNPPFAELAKILNNEQNKYIESYKFVLTQIKKHRSPSYSLHYNKHFIEFMALEKEVIKEVYAIKAKFAQNLQLNSEKLDFFQSIVEADFFQEIKDSELFQSIKEKLSTRSIDISTENRYQKYFNLIDDLQKLRIPPNNPLRKAEFYTEITEVFKKANTKFIAIREREEQFNAINQKLKQLRVNLKNKYDAICHSSYKIIVPEVNQAFQNKVEIENPNKLSIEPLQTLDSFKKNNPIIYKTTFEENKFLMLSTTDREEIELFINNECEIDYSDTEEMQRQYKSFKEYQDKLMFSLNRSIASINYTYKEKLTARAEALTNKTISPAFNSLLKFALKQLRGLNIPTSDTKFNFFESDIATFEELDSIIEKIIEASLQYKKDIALNLSQIQKNKQQLLGLRTFLEKLQKIARETSQKKFGNLGESLKIQIDAVIKQIVLEIAQSKHNLDALEKTLREQSLEVKIISTFINDFNINIPIVNTLITDLERAKDRYINNTLDNNQFHQAIILAINNLIENPALVTMVEKAPITEIYRNFLQGFDDFLKCLASVFMTPDPQKPMFFSTQIQECNVALEAKEAHGKLLQLKQNLPAPEI